jgi:hypothetical protein
MTNITAVYNYLEEQGIKHSNLGFRFLASAIMLGIESPAYCMKIAGLYEEVAKEHDSNRACVERAIRNSIPGRRVTNKEFIAKAVDTLTAEQLEYKENVSKIGLIHSSTVISTNNG